LLTRSTIWPACCRLSGFFTKMLAAPIPSATMPCNSSASVFSCMGFPLNRICELNSGGGVERVLEREPVLRNSLRCIGADGPAEHEKQITAVRVHRIDHTLLIRAVGFAPDIAAAAEAFGIHRGLELRPALDRARIQMDVPERGELLGAVDLADHRHAVESGDDRKPKAGIAELLAQIVDVALAVIE